MCRSRTRRIDRFLWPRVIEQTIRERLPKDSSAPNICWNMA